MIGILPPLVSASWSIYWTCSESWLQVSCTKRTRLCLIVSPPCSSCGLAIWAFLPVMKTALNGILLKSVRARCFTFSRRWSFLFLSWSKQIFIRCTLSLRHWANWAVWLNAQSLFWISTISREFVLCLSYLYALTLPYLSSRNALDQRSAATTCCLRWSMLCWSQTLRFCTRL